MRAGHRCDFGTRWTRRLAGPHRPKACTAVVSKWLFRTLIATGPLFHATTLPAAVAADSVKVESSIDGRVFIWRITNVSAPPITKLNIPVYAVYHEQVPEGWTFDRSDKNMLAASVTSHANAIHKGQTREFSVRATSSSGILDVTSGTVGFLGGDTLSIDGIWAPRQELKSTMLIPPLIIVGLIVIQFLCVRRGEKADESSLVPS